MPEKEPLRDEQLAFNEGSMKQRTSSWQSCWGGSKTLRRLKEAGADQETINKCQRAFRSGYIR